METLFHTGPQVFPPVSGDGDGTATSKDPDVNTEGRLLRQCEVIHAGNTVVFRKGGYGSSAAPANTSLVLRGCSPFTIFCGIATVTRCKQTQIQNTKTHKAKGILV